MKHRGKILSAITNAQLVLEIQREHGSLVSFFWSLLPDGRPVVNTWECASSHHPCDFASRYVYSRGLQPAAAVLCRAMADVPTTTPLATEISKNLKKRGFKFVGPTMIYSFMQATGMLLDHTTCCFRYRQILDMHQNLPQELQARCD